MVAGTNTTAPCSTTPHLRARRNSCLECQEYTGAQWADGHTSYNNCNLTTTATLALSLLILREDPAPHVLKGTFFTVAQNTDAVNPTG